MCDLGARAHDRLLGDLNVAAQFSFRTQLQRMLEVEAALADAEASIGVVPTTCVEPIRSAARAELYDCAAIAAEAVDAGNVVIPVVRHLTTRGRGDRHRCGTVCSLGRDQSGHSGHRFGVAAPRRRTDNP